MTGLRVEPAGGHLYMWDRLIKTEVNIRRTGRITCGRKKGPTKAGQIPAAPRPDPSGTAMACGEIKGYRCGQKRGSTSSVAGGHPGGRDCRRTRAGIGASARGVCQLAKRLLAG